MKAIVHYKNTGLDGVFYTDIDEGKVKAGFVKVKLKAAGLNRRDLMVTRRHGIEEPPLVLGSDGAGVISEVGESVTSYRVGDEVVINPGLGWHQKSDAPPEGFEILGLPDHGTFAEYIVVSADHVEQKPAFLTWEEAGVLPLAALTAYRVLFSRAKIEQSDTILLPGIGSGVATFLLLFAKTIGARVIVTSRSYEKRKKALELGADLAIDTNSDWNKSLNGEKADVVIESVGEATFEKSLKQLRQGGTLVTFGATTNDEIKIDIRKFFYGQYNLLGSTMGSREEFREMLQFVQKHKINPIIDKVYPLEDGVEALKRMKESENFGKIALTILR